MEQFGSRIRQVSRILSVIQFSSCVSCKKEMAVDAPMSRTVDLTSCPVPRESPASAAARSRHRRKRSTSQGRQKYCPSSAYQKPKHARSTPCGFCVLISARARSTTSAMTHPHCMDARGSPCSAPLRARYFSPEGRKIMPQLSWHQRDQGWSSGMRSPTAVSMDSWRSDGKAF